MKILMVAAENDALLGGKVGGIGDVVRDVPPALARCGCAVTVVTPAYGVFANLPDAQRLAMLEVGFGGMSEYVDVYEVPGRQPNPAVRHIVLDHPLFAVGGPGNIYCDDPPEAPFATDANKFALFCLAVCEGLAMDAFGSLDVIHLHDWHAALLLVLRRYHPAYQALQQIRCAYTIHNLALQGIRPLSGHASSLATWYPGLVYDPATLVDPRWSDCINLMAVGIRLADAVHTVSPSYAEEILRPSAVTAHGYYGGEGLEIDLRSAQAEERLFGILNGCEYPSEPTPNSRDWTELVTLMRAQVLRWVGRTATPVSAHFIAHVRLAELNSERPGMVLTSVGRITEQKFRLLHQTTSAGRPALEEILDALGDRGVLLLLGSGEPGYERYLTEITAHYDNLVFLRGYSDSLAQALYAYGDLFLMPSSFEPCGISQMLALRAGQPCLVHHVGGLRDTVTNHVTGITFSGTNLSHQADNLVTALKYALTLYSEQPERWQNMQRAAAAVRFNWEDSVDAYLNHLYHHTRRDSHGDA